MKCPKRLKIVQSTIRKPFLSDEAECEGTTVLEYQEFCDCYENECCAWDDRRKRCKDI